MCWRWFHLNSVRVSHESHAHTLLVTIYFTSNLQTQLWGNFRRKFCSAKILTAKIPFGEKSVRRNFRSAKIPFGENSVRQKFLRRKFLRQKFFRRKFLAPFKSVELLTIYLEFSHIRQKQSMFFIVKVVPYIIFKV